MWCVVEVGIIVDRFIMIGGIEYQCFFIMYLINDISNK